MNPEMIMELVANADTKTLILVAMLAGSELVGASSKIKSNGLFSLVCTILKDGVKAQMVKREYKR